MNEIEDKLELLIAEYEHHMKIHKMKIKRGTLQSLIVTPAELLEDLIKLKWGQVGQKLFSLRQHKIALLEAEASSPGREVAFVR